MKKVPLRFKQLRDEGNEDNYDAYDDDDDDNGYDNYKDVEEGPFKIQAVEG